MQSLCLVGIEKDRNIIEGQKLDKTENPCKYRGGKESNTSNRIRGSKRII